MPSSWLDELFSQIAASGEGNGADAMRSESLVPADGSFNPARDSQAFSDYGQTFFGGDNGEFGRPAVEQNVAPAMPVNQSASAAPVFRTSDFEDREPGGYNPAATARQAQPGMLDALGKKADIARNPDGSINYSDPKTIDSLMRLVLGAGSVASALTRSKTTPQNFQSAADMRKALLGSYNNWTPQQQASSDAFFNTPMQTGVNHPKLYAAQMPSSLTPARNYADGGPVNAPDDVMQELQQALEKRRAYGWSRAPDVQALTQQDREMFGKMAPSAQLARMRAMLKGVQTPNMPSASMSARVPEPYADGGSVGGGGSLGSYIQQLYSRYPWLAQAQQASPSVQAAPITAATPVESRMAGLMQNFGSSAPAAAGPAVQGSGTVWDATLAQASAPAPAPAMVAQAPAPAVRVSAAEAPAAQGALAQMSAAPAPMAVAAAPGGAPVQLMSQLAAPPMPTPFNGATATPAEANTFAQQQAAYTAGVPAYVPKADDPAARAGWWSPYQMAAPTNYAAWAASSDNWQNAYNPNSPRYSAGKLVDAQGNDITAAYLAAHPAGMAVGGSVGGVQATAPDGALGYSAAHTGGQDDVVPINAAGGEYVLDADVVSALGDGNNAAGAAKLDELRKKLRQEKRATPVDQIPDKTKPLKHYIKGL